MRKLHANLAQAALEIIKQVLQDSVRASRALSKAIQHNPKWGARDRKLIYTIVYDILRWKRKYEALLSLVNTATKTEQLLHYWCFLNQYQKPETKKEIPLNIKKDTSLTPAEMAAFPDWIFELGKKELGDVWPKECTALNEKAEVALRVNRLRAHPKKVQQQLDAKYNIPSHYSSKYPDALLLAAGRKLDKNPLFLKGFFEIQDAHSQKIAPFTNVQPGMAVIDLCAGAGGKSLHLAALMRNKGTIKAFDIVPNKLKELRKRGQRAGVKIIQTEPITRTTDFKQLNAWADVVLIDAPCSGLGTLKRNPEIKWRLTPERLDELKALQEQLLTQASSWLKPNGVMVYATCSILPSENEQQITTFLTQHPEFEVEEQHAFFAHQSPYDGFFMVRLRRLS